jgi:hypothetical protein
VESELTNVVTDKLIGQTRKAMLVTIMNLKVKRTTIQQWICNPSIGTFKMMVDVLEFPLFFFYLFWIGLGGRHFGWGVELGVEMYIYICIHPHSQVIFNHKTT